MLVVFRATWCGHCHAEIPELEALRKEHQGQGLVVLAVNIQDDEGPEAARQHLSDLGVDFTAVRDETRAVQATYRVAGTPTNFFVDRLGVLRGQQAGAMNRMAPQRKLAAIL